MTDPATNREKHEALVADLRELLARTAEGGPEKARARHISRASCCHVSASINCLIPAVLS